MRIELRNDTAANWTAANPVLAAGEFGCENDTLLFKKGDGTTAWNALPYANAGSVPTALKFSAIAKTNLAAESVVAIDGAGNAYNPDLTNPADVANIVGICATAALAGNTVTVQTIGTLTEALWNWQEGPIYCDVAGGALTQAAPATGAVVQVATAITSQTIQVGIGPAYLRN
ncbi:MAG TPA: hypothetical protein VN085_05125 [Vicinamibacterales bacterium]|nr:hypothetical protein [Vicinamibacterales bacterium]